MTSPGKTWFIVADGASASIFEREGRNAELSPVMRMHSDDAQERSGELVTDRPGRHRGGGGVHPYSPRTDAHRHEEEIFVKSVADYVLDKSPDADFDRLVIIAPARTIGMFRKALPKKLMDTVTDEIEKDIVHLTDHQIADHIRDLDRG